MPALSLLDSSITKAEVTLDGGTTWRELVGITNLNVQREQAQTRTVNAWGNRSRQIAGAAGGKTATFEGIRPPNDITWKDTVAKADSSDRNLSIRVESTQDRTVVPTTAAPDTVAIVKATSVATFASLPGTGVLADLVSPGQYINDGSDNYLITAITGDTTCTVSPEPSSDVAATAYSIVERKSRRQFTGDLINAGQDQLPEGGELTDTLVLSVTSDTDWTAIT